MNSKLSTTAGNLLLGTALITFITCEIQGQTFTKVTAGPVGSDVGSYHGVAVGDYNNDGVPDVFVANATGTNLLYRNNGDGTFTKIDAGLITSESFVSTGGAWADYDNDGFLDLFITNSSNQNNELFRNNGNGTFTKITTGDIVTNGGWSFGASWADYDRDGFVDLFVPDNFAANFLYHNNGNGTFTRIVTGPLVTGSSGSNEGVWGDYNNDGNLDLFVANSAGSSKLYRNQGSGQFQQITAGPVGADTTSAAGACWGDYNNDGWLDLFVANRPGANVLYRNNGDGTFTRITTGAIVTESFDSNGCAWGDLDNDGFIDLVVANWNGQNDSFFRNNGDGTFTKVTTGPLVNDGANGVGLALADFNGDGYLDIFVGNSGGSMNGYFRNDGGANHYLKVRLVGLGSNRTGIGAKVKVTATIGGVVRTLVREISGGESFSSQSSQVAHFGLGNATTLEELRVEWPSGAVTILNSLPADQRVVVQENNPSFTHVIPSGYENVDGNYYSGTLHESQLRLQVVYDSANFPPGAKTITELRFRRDIGEPPFGSTTAAATVKLSTTTRGSGALSQTFSDNSGPDETTVFAGNWTYSSQSNIAPGNIRPFEIALPLSTPFTYDPALGNLLFDIRITSNSTLNWTDGVNGSGGGVSRVVSLNANATTGNAGELTGDVIQLVYYTDPTVTFSPSSGTFTNALQVSIVTGVPNSFVRYTTDGNDPTVTSTVYSGPITLTQTTTVKARLFVNGFPASDIATATYTRYVPPDIEFIPPGRLFTNQLSVTLVNNVGAGTIRYTLDGSAPTSTSTGYVGPLNLTAAATVRAQVFVGNFLVSDEFQESYARVYAFGNDGVPFSWREQYFGPNFLTDPCAAADADCDGDSYSVAEEYQHGTDPTVREIILSVRAVPRLTFTTEAGQSYEIQRATTLDPADWETIVPSILATGSELHYVDEEAPDNSYYRIRKLPN